MTMSQQPGATRSPGNQPTLDPVSFLTELWGASVPNNRLRIQIWTRETKRTRLLHAPAGAAGITDKADVYTGVALSREHPVGQRPTARDARAIAGFWLDVDQRTTGKPNGVNDVDEVMNGLLEPTITVSTGNGSHAWWLFPQPWVFSDAGDLDRAAIASAQWFELHRRVALEQHGALDAVHDLARLMRIPGTWNAKTDTRLPVSGRSHGPRYEREHLLDLAATAGTVTASTSTAGRGDRAAVRVAPNSTDGVSLEKLDLLLAQPEFAALWRHERDRGWSTSEYDLALCSLMIQANWTDQQLADLIGRHRREWQDKPEKSLRVDYLQRTIGLARVRTASEIASEQLGELAMRRGRA